MGAVLYRLRSGLRARWFATATLTLLVGVSTGAVFAVVAGAVRTTSAPNRYTSSVGGEFDALVTQGQEGRPRTADVAGLAAVRSVQAATFFFGAIQLGPHEYSDASPFSGEIEPSGTRIVDGRAPDPDDEHEFVATQNFVDATGAELGATFDMVTLSQEQVDREGFTQNAPEGPTIADMVLVGVLAGPSQLDDPSPLFLVSPALLKRPEIAVSLTLMSVRLQDGYDVADLRLALDALPDGARFQIEPGRIISDEVRRAVDAQSQGLWLLALAAGIAAVAAIGQVLVRNVRVAPTERDRMSAVGFTDAQLMIESVSRAAIPIALGALLGVGVAIAASGTFPFGFVRRLEPHVGVRADWMTLLLCAFGAVALLLAWVVASLAFARWASRVVRPSPVVEALATRSSSATVATGLRFAYTRRGADRGSACAAVSGVFVSVAALVGALVFGVSLDTLVDTPARYGNNYDLSIGDNGAAGLSDELVDAVDADPAVRSLVLYTNGSARRGDATVPIVGMRSIRGTSTPVMSAGRLPATDDEIALGRLTAEEFGVGIGDSLALTGLTRTGVLRVTGIAVVPGLGANDGMGEGGIMTTTGLQRLDDTVAPTAAVVQLYPNSYPSAKTLALTGEPPSGTYLPADILNVSRIRAVPFLLAALLALLAIVTTAHVMLTSLRSRRRDVAVLRSLGADQRWVTRAMHWQATTFTLLPVALGVPAGMLVGRTVFIVFADSMGVVNAATFSWLHVGTVFAGFLLLANLVALLPAHRARRIDPAIALQRE